MVLIFDIDNIFNNSYLSIMEPFPIFMGYKMLFNA